MTPSQYRRAAELVEMIHREFSGFSSRLPWGACARTLLCRCIQGHPGSKKSRSRCTSTRSACPGDCAPWTQRIWKSLGTGSHSLDGCKILPPRWHSNRPNRLNHSTFFGLYPRLSLGRSKNPEAGPRHRQARREEAHAILGQPAMDR